MTFFAIMMSHNFEFICKHVCMNMHLNFYVEIKTALQISLLLLHYIFYEFMNLKKQFLVHFSVEKNHNIIMEGYNDTVFRPISIDEIPRKDLRVK